MARKQADGVDLALLRDTHAYYFEGTNGHHAETLDELHYADWPKLLEPNDEEARALRIGGLLAIPMTRWPCEGYRLRDTTGRLRGHLQVRYGVVRAVAARREDADLVDPLANGRNYRQTCRGEIVLQEPTGPMALRFEAEERAVWLERAIAAILATPEPNRA